MDLDLKDLNERGVGKLPGLIGLEFTGADDGFIAAKLEIRDELLAPNGYLHAATVIALADTACGYGCITNLPEGADMFTTIELKSNFLGTAREGTIFCEARLAHSGRTTQVWDATVTGDDGRNIALFRCTQMVIYPR